MEYDGKFYIGRTYDTKAKKTLTDLTLYDPDDLTTHGVVVGMTGSGKTGLCIDILEEAALNGIPALLLDPKGDIANLLLHFPQLAPEDFQTWIDSEEARREAKSVEQFATDISKVWRKGLSDWGIEPERIERVRNAVQYAVYTPGSDAGLPISVLASLKAPQIPWEKNRELLREKISSTVTALLSLVGIVIASYLSYIEITQETAFCGPVGDCNSVQHSSYAKLFGVVPIGLLGLAGYVAILVAWYLSRKNTGPIKTYAVLILMGMTFFGTTFSIYLTYLEPFVIGATCMWCVLSAVIMTAQMWLMLPPTLEVLEAPKEENAEDAEPSA